MDRYAELRAALADGWVQSIHPDTVRALLAERDALREALDLVNDLSSQEWQDQNGKRMAATGNDGKRFWFITDDVMRVARAALAQEQGGSDEQAH